jgi:hypothetical protein
MHYLDLELGQDYRYHDQRVRLVGTRVVTQVDHGEDAFFATIALPGGARKVVKPHELTYENWLKPRSREAGCAHERVPVP